MTRSQEGASDASAPDRRGAPRPRAGHGHGRCTGDDASDSQVPPGRLRKDLLVQCQVGDRAAKLVAAHPAIFLAPPIERDLTDPHRPPAADGTTCAPCRETRQAAERERYAARRAWFLSEPDHIMVLHRGADADRALLSELMRG